MACSVEPLSKKARTDASTDCEVHDPMKMFDAQGDLDILIEGDVIRVHSAYLGSSSPVFAALLTSNMREGLSRKLELPGKSKEELEMFLSFLRPLSRVRVTAENVDQMLPWFDEYQIMMLKKDCESVLLDLPVTTDRLMQAHKFCLEKLYRQCLYRLTYSQFLADFEKFANEVEVLREVMPIIQRKNKELTWAFFVIQEVLNSNVPLKNSTGVLELCLKHGNFVDEALAKDLVMLMLDASDVTRAITVLLTRVLEAKELEASRIGKIQAEMMHLKSAYTTICARIGYNTFKNDRLCFDAMQQMRCSIETLERAT